MFSIPSLQCTCTKDQSARVPGCFVEWAVRFVDGVAWKASQTAQVATCPLTNTVQTAVLRQDETRPRVCVNHVQSCHAHRATDLRVGDITSAR